MAHVHSDIPEAKSPIRRNGPSPGPGPGGWIQVSLDAFEVPSRHEYQPHLRKQPAKNERLHGHDVDPALVGIAAAFSGMVAIGLLGKALAGFLFWLL